MNEMDDDDDELLNGWLSADEDDQPVQCVNTFTREKHIEVDSAGGH